MKERVGKVDLSRFRLRYCITQKKKFSPHQRVPVEVVVGNRNLEELNEWLFKGGIAVRRELADVWAQMPPLTINHLQVQLDTDPELRQMLRSMEKQTMSQIQEDIGRKEEHISTLRRKIGVAKVKHSVSEIVDRVEAGIWPILIGAVHHDVIDALDVALQAAGLEVGVIDGRTGPTNRQIMISGFNTAGVDVLIGQIQAMGVSLNLQGGSHIVCVETTFSPAEQDQFYARCHRLGQKDHVHVDVFEADVKLEKAVRRILSTKARGHNTLMDQGAAA
jgi:SNF2 family DNA or RNA helicase